jgi:hypothetical protein
MLNGMSCSFFRLCLALSGMLFDMVSCLHRSYMWFAYLEGREEEVGAAQAHSSGQEESKEGSTSSQQTAISIPHLKMQT